MPPHPADFCIFSRDGVYHVDQAGLDLLTSGDVPASASQSAGITDMSHCAWLPFQSLKMLLYNTNPSSPFAFISVSIHGRVHVVKEVKSSLNNQKPCQIV